MYITYVYMAYKYYYVFQYAYYAYTTFHYVKHWIVPVEKPYDMDWEII